MWWELGKTLNKLIKEIDPLEVQIFEEWRALVLKILNFVKFSGIHLKKSKLERNVNDKHKTSFWKSSENIGKAIFNC